MLVAFKVIVNVMQEILNSGNGILQLNKQNILSGQSLRKRMKKSMVEKKLKNAYDCV